MGAGVMRASRAAARVSANGFLPMLGAPNTFEKRADALLGEALHSVSLIYLLGTPNGLKWLGANGTTLGQWGRP